MSAETYTIKTALEQIEKCDFECEGGPLANNTGWRWLKEHLTRGPKFHLGQWVYMDVTADANGVKLRQWVNLCVVGISMSSDTERRTWKYHLSSDPPSAYHYGAGVQFQAVDERSISETNPGAAAPLAEAAK